MPDDRKTWEDVERETGVSKSTLVRWESEGLLPKLRRLKRTNARIFTPEYIAKAKEIKNETVEPAEEPATKKRGGRR